MNRQAIVEGGCTKPRIPPGTSPGSRPLSSKLVLGEASLLVALISWVVLFMPPLGFEAAAVLGTVGIALSLFARWRASNRLERILSLISTLLNGSAALLAVVHALRWV
jgi:multisubunit Na+/H+ antiporter MnhB subunit